MYIKPAHFDLSLEFDPVNKQTKNTQTAKNHPELQPLIYIT